MNGYLDPAQAALCRLVLDMKNPWQDFCPFGPLNLDKTNVSKASFLNLKSLANANLSSRFKVALSKVLNIFAESSRTTVDDISTKTAMRYQLLNVTLNFEKIFDDDNVKRWLEKVVLTGAKVYMVVGLHTIQDASISLNRDTSTDFGGGIQVPITDSVVPGTSALPEGGELLDVKLEGGHTSKSSLGASFVTPGERIIAVQYQEVAFKISSSRSTKSIADAGVKKKTAWKTFGAARGGRDDIDTLEAILAEETTADDMEEDVEFQAMSTEDGDLFVILE